MTLPLPVKINKFGERVVDIGIKKYYHQIAEEVLEAHAARILNNQKVSDDEAEELVDVITCCVTRFAIIDWYEEVEKDFNTYVKNLVSDAEKEYEEPKGDFYTGLLFAVMKSYRAAFFDDFIGTLHDEDDTLGISCILDAGVCDEESALAEIIVLCIKRLEFLGYDEKARQKMYNVVNEKNRKRGYLDEI